MCCSPNLLSIRRSTGKHNLAGLVVKVNGDVKIGACLCLGRRYPHELGGGGGQPTGSRFYCAGNHCLV